MADKIPVKAIYTSSDVTALGEFEPGDTINVIYVNGALTSSDIGSTIQAYDADTAKTDTIQTWTAQQTFTETAETVYTLTGTAVDPANGTLQKKTLSAAYTPTFSLTSGQSVLLNLIDADTYTVTWTNIGKWYGDTPTDFGSDLTGDDAFIIWHDGVSICALYAGGYAA